MSRSKTFFVNMFDPESLETSVMHLQKEIIRIESRHQIKTNHFRKEQEKYFGSFNEISEDFQLYQNNEFSSVPEMHFLNETEIDPDI